MYDFKITNVRIVDGTGAPYFHGEVAVREGKIVELGRRVEGDAHRVIDGHGLSWRPTYRFSQPLGYNVVLGPPGAQIDAGVTEIGQCGARAAPFGKLGPPMETTTEEGSPIT